MADQKVEATFDDEEIVEFFKSMRSKLKKIENGEKKFVCLFSAIVFCEIISHFTDQQGSQGPWQKWSDSYEEHMKEIGRGANKILQFSGKLRNNFKPANVRNTNEGLTWFNDAQTAGGFPYAAAHDEGGTRLPKRDFMWLSDAGAEKIADQTLAFMLEEGVA